MLDVFKNPTRKTAWLVTIVAGLVLLGIMLIDTGNFSKKFDPDPLIGIPLVLALWLIARVWVNYYKQAQ